MQRTRYSAELKAEALLIYASDGAAAAQAATGIPAGTIASWASRTGVQGARAEEIRPRTEAARLSNDERKAQLATNLLADVERLRLQMFAPCVEKIVRSVSDGLDAGSHLETHDIELDEPTFTNKRALATAMGTLIDKIQLLHGQAPGKENGGAQARGQLLNEARERATHLRVA